MMTRSHQHNQTGKGKKKNEHSPPDQTPPEDLINDLQEQLRALRVLPGDFRDIAPNSPEWRDYRETVPEATEAMDKWLVGPVLCYGRALTPYEREILERNHQRVMYSVVEPNSVRLADFFRLLENAEGLGVAHIYLKGFPNSIAVAINYMASFLKLPMRARHEYSPEQTTTTTTQPTEEEED